MSDDVVVSQSKTRTPAYPYPNAEAKLKEAGFEALRSNSLFCTGDIRRAEDYGEPYVIFPKNGFKFTWSWKNVDYFSRDDAYYNRMNADEFIRYEGLSNINLNGAIVSGNAVLIKGKFIAINEKYFVRSKIWELLFE
jgi:hypothetical protein